jgi:autotransporter-associated beta strand protein
VAGIVLRMFGTGTSQPTFTFDVAAGSTADGIDLVVGPITRFSPSEDLTTSIIKAGGGTLRLTGTNTFVAPLVISGGKLEVGGSGSLGAGAYSAAISVAAGATMSYASSASQTLAGLITGAGGLAKSSASNLTLSAANNYSGPTTISGGTLSLTPTGAIASSGTVTVGDTGSTGAVLNLTSMSSSFAFGAGQTVRGIGTINIGEGKTVSSAGIWAPGNSIGSNTVTGNLALTGTSQFELGTPGGSLSNPGSSDFTAVSGTLTLGGNLALLDNANAGGLGSYGAGAYRLFTASAVSGTFASVTAPAGATTTRVGMVYTAGAASGQGVFANVYNLASAAAAQTINLGSMYSGTSKTAAVTLTNTAPSNATFTETLSGSFSDVTTNFLATGSVSGIAGGADGAGSLLVGLGSGLVAGIHSGTATLAVFSNAVNSSGLAQQSVGSQAITITGTVWNPAAVNTVSTPVSFGNVIVGGSFGTQALSITNTAPGGIYTEVLGATASTSGQATSLGSVAALAGGSTSTAISVGLGGAAYTGSVGVKTGTATLAFTSTGGPGTANIDSQAIALTGTVLDHAESSLASTLLTGTTISLGQYNYASNAWENGGDTGFFTIFNLASIFGADLTADLSLVGVSGTANGFTTNLGSYTDIAGGQSRQFSIFFDPTGLTTSTTRTTTFQIQFSDKTGMSGATNTNTLFVTAQVIVVPEPGSRTLAGVGIALTGWLVSRRKYINL